MKRLLLTRIPRSTCLNIASAVVTLGLVATAGWFAYLFNRESGQLVIEKGYLTEMGARYDAANATIANDQKQLDALGAVVTDQTATIQNLQGQVNALQSQLSAANQRSNQPTVIIQAPAATTPTPSSGPNSAGIKVANYLGIKPSTAETICTVGGFVSKLLSTACRAGGY